ncbi:MAG: hypothetical protein JWP64_5567 [Pseudonocardia sp.]|nr:hypothetical protein [Pseudonocardia sp.]
MNDDQSVADLAAEIGRALATGREVDLRARRSRRPSRHGCAPTARPGRRWTRGRRRWARTCSAPAVSPRRAACGSGGWRRGSPSSSSTRRWERPESRTPSTRSTPTDRRPRSWSCGPPAPRPAGCGWPGPRWGRSRTRSRCGRRPGVSTWTTSPTGRCTTHAGSTSGRGYGCSSTRCRTSCPVRTSSWPRPTGRAGTRSSRRRSCSRGSGGATPRPGRRAGSGARCSTGRWGSATAPGRLLAPRRRVTVDLQRARRGGPDPRNDRGGGRGPDPRARLGGLRGWGTGAPEGVRRGRARGPRPPSGCPRPPPAPPR